MRSSWNFSTAIFEIWVLVLTKPGWANETPMTSLRVPREYPEYHQHHHHPYHEEQQHQHHNQHHHNHYGVASSSSGDWSSGAVLRERKHHSDHHFHHQPHASALSSSSSYYSRSSSQDKNNNHYYSSSSSSSNHPQNHPPYNSNYHHQHPQYASSSDSKYSSSASSSAYAAAASMPHRCYVCLPPNKNSREAQQILQIFANELRPLIPDCAQFDPYVDAGRFEFDCPPKYGGCILRIHGSNVSRACSKYRVNDCKKANSVEFCYCTTPLCNDKKPEPPVIPAVIHHQYQGNSGGKGKSIKSKSSVVLRGDEQGGNSSPQGIRARVSEDDEDNPSDDDDTGSGTGSDSDDDDGSNENKSQNRQNPFIDPFTGTTMDPTIFHEESSFAVAVEDPNPHTKIGISMTASTSGASGSISVKGSSSATTLLGSSLWCYWWWFSSGSCRSSQGPLSSNGTTHGSSIFHHLFLHLQRAVYVHLFDQDHHLPPPPKQSSETAEISVVVVGSSSSSYSPSNSNSGSNNIVIDSTSCRSRSSSHYHHYLCEASQVAEVEEEMHKWENTRPPPPPPTTPHLPEATSPFVYSPVWCFLSGQLCFIISLLLLGAQALFS